jgi:hypothetical protein
MTPQEQAAATDRLRRELREMQERLTRRTELFEAHCERLLAEIAGARHAVADLHDAVMRHLAEVQERLDAMAADLRSDKSPIPELPRRCSKRDFGSVAGTSSVPDSCHHCT